jgi:hypothetical protein
MRPEEHAEGSDCAASICRVSHRSSKKPVEEPQGESQANTDENGSHQRRVELEAWPFDADIARQAPEPAQLVSSKPEQQAYDSQENTDADQHFAELLHG